jgi:ribosomal protein S18 acetylase RimI-like enzyme
VTIRRGGPLDAAPAAALVARAYAHYVPRIGRPPAPMDADYAAIAAAGTLWCLEAEGRLAGMIVIEPRADHLFVETVAVDPDLSGRGHGRALLGFAEAEARAAGLAAVELYTNALMTENQRFYPALGYRETGRRSEHGFDRVFYRKELDLIS